jgi:replicative DNA helicase
MDAPKHAQAPHHSERLRSLATLIEETDATIRSGVSAGARVWPTGFDALDTSLTGGLRAGELALLGGSHGEGKTTMGLQILRNAVAGGGSGVAFSFEHEAHTLLERLISLEAFERVGPGATRVNQVRNAFEHSNGVRSLGDMLAALPGGTEAFAALTAYGDRLHIHESSGAATDLDEISRIVAAVGRTTGQPPLVLVDYLQKVPMAADVDEGARITAVTEGLKDLALDIGSPVVAVSAADKESLVAGHRMRTHDLRGSSSLAYEADVVLLLSNKASIVSREHLVYDLGNVDRFNQLSVVSIEKNRHGHAGVALEFLKDFEHGRFHTEGHLVAERLIDERVILT